MMVFFLAGIVGICGFLTAVELICRVWEAMERRAARKARRYRYYEG